jgi:membrane protein required for colicin V production
MGWSGSPLDAVVLAIIGVAVVRGLLRGLLREVFSIAALGGACLAVRYGTPLVSTRIGEWSGDALGSVAATWIAGVVLACAAIGLVTVLGRVARRGARAAGLGWADRVGGGALGAAEGALVAALLLVGVTWLAPAHPLVAGSRSVVALQELQLAVRGDAERADVAAAPPP